MGDVLTRVYRKGVLETEGFPVADVSEYLEEPDTLVWVDFCGPSIDQLHALAAELGLHELAVEDALSTHQRPKLDRYASHLFLSTHAVRLDSGACRLDETEIDAFISPRWLVTVRKGDSFPIPPVLERWDRSPDLAAQGVGYSSTASSTSSSTPTSTRSAGSTTTTRRSARDSSRRALSTPVRSGAGSRCTGPWSASTGWSCPCGRL